MASRPHAPAGIERGTLYALQTKPPLLLAMAPDGSSVRTVIADLGGTPDGVQVDAVRGMVYWTNMGHDFRASDGTIECCALTGSNRRTLVGDGAVVTPKQLALDADAGLLYWCDREGMRVMRARVDGGEVTTLVCTGSIPDEQADETRQCVGIALDRPNGHVYWTQKGPSDGGQGRIFRAGLELPPGASPRARPDIELMLDGLPEPIDLGIDNPSGTLYWTDRGNLPDGNTLNRAHLGGSTLSERTVVARGLTEAIGIAFDFPARRAFVSDLGGSVRMIDLASGGVTTVFAGGPLTGLAFVGLQAADRQLVEGENDRRRTLPTGPPFLHSIVIAER